MHFKEPGREIREIPLLAAQRQKLGRSQVLRNRPHGGHSVSLPSADALRHTRPEAAIRTISDRTSQILDGRLRRTARFRIRSTSLQDKRGGIMAQAFDLATHVQIPLREEARSSPRMRRESRGSTSAKAATASNQR